MIDGKVLLIILGLIILIVVGCVVYSYYKTPFSFPYEHIQFNVTGTRQPKIEDYIDEYIIKNKISPIETQMDRLKQWKMACEYQIQKSVFKRRRREQYTQCLDESRMYHFVFTREKTRYRQVNYVKYPYKVTETVEDFYCSYDYLMERYNQLKSINFEAVLSDYNSKKQRSLMTKELREKIAIRDNYTCRLCGKYMGDGVGLQIDHIVPIAKGGKSISSNLQVLCSKCNGSKSSKTGANGDAVERSNQNIRLENSLLEEDINYSNFYSEKLIDLKNQAVLAYQNKEIEKVFKLIEKAERVPRQGERNGVCLHFFYQDLVGIIYAMRTYYENAMQDCLLLCNKDIELLASLSFGERTTILTVTRKAIILEKEGKYWDAIELCDYAIKKGYLDNGKPFLIRKKRLEEKVKKQG